MNQQGGSTLLSLSKSSPRRSALSPHPKGTPLEAAESPGSTWNRKHSA